MKIRQQNCSRPEQSKNNEIGRVKILLDFLRGQKTMNKKTVFTCPSPLFSVLIFEPFFGVSFRDTALIEFIRVCTTFSNGNVFGKK